MFMIDEYLILGVVVVVVEGVICMNGLVELCVKESDCLMGIFDLLILNGVEMIICDDGLDVVGMGGMVLGGGYVIIYYDYWIVMSVLVLGLIVEDVVIIDDVSMIVISYLDFFDYMLGLGVIMEFME